MPSARHIAAVNTPCSVQSPARVRATSSAGAKLVSKFLFLRFVATHLVIAWTLAQGSVAWPTARRARETTRGSSEVTIGLGRRYSGSTVEGPGAPALGPAVRTSRIAVRGSGPAWIDCRASTGKTRAGSASVIVTL